jgi:hypothetical protein
MRAIRQMKKDVWEYRKIMEKMMNAGGLVWFATDEPEISSHPANCLTMPVIFRCHDDVPFHLFIHHADCQQRFSDRTAPVAGSDLDRPEFSS